MAQGRWTNWITAVRYIHCAKREREIGYLIAGDHEEILGPDGRMRRG